jgi:hypothetical protein
MVPPVFSIETTVPQVKEGQITLPTCGTFYFGLIVIVKTRKTKYGCLRNFLKSLFSSTQRHEVSKTQRKNLREFVSLRLTCTARAPAPDLL